MVKIIFELADGTGIKFTSLDVFTLCFSEKLPAAGDLAFILESNDLI